MANGLDRLLSLTFNDDHLPDDRAGVWVCVEDFRRRMHDHYGERIPMVVTIERGKENNRLHVHIAYGRFLDANVIAALWGRGFVDLRKIKVSGEGKRAGCRRAAQYVAKYVTKDDLDDRELNQRRYSVTVGFKPRRSSQRVESFLAGLDLAAVTCGGEVEFRWDSSEDPDWCGPPVHVVAYGDPGPNQ